MTTRALVLGGGGPVGLAWQAGLLAGFARAGLDLNQAEEVLGTSAGALAGARLRLAQDPARLADLELATQPGAGEGLPKAGPDFRRVRELMNEAQGGSRNPAEVRRELGALALAHRGWPPEAFLALVAQSLGAPSPAWPARAFACAAIDVEDGGFQLWGGDAGQPLLPAVAASCALPAVFPPVEIGGRRYMDGGLRSMTNADLAGGHDVVVVVAVQVPGALEYAPGQLADEVEGLKAGGSTVVVITPDEDACAAMGDDLLDFGRSAAVAQAGLAQAAAQAEVLGQVWG